MSIDRPNLSPESPEEKYRKLLSAGIETNKKYNQLSQSPNQEEDRSLAYEYTEEQMESQMQERVNLLRQSGATNIESVFPRAKMNEEAKEANRQLGELQKKMTEKLMKGISDPNFDMSELNEMKDHARELQARELMAKSKFQKLNEQEIEEFGKALKKLAEDNGYEIESDGMVGGWVTLKKGGFEFRMRHFIVPSEDGIGGYSRISKMDVCRKTKGEDDECLLVYDRGWHVANQDPEVQQEIDRVVAIFG